MELIKRILANFLRFGQVREQRNGLSKQTDQIKARLKNDIKNDEGRPYQDTCNMKPKFFLQISDHQQSLAPPRGLPHTPGSAGGR